MMARKLYIEKLYCGHTINLIKNKLQSYICKKLLAEIYELIFLLNDAVSTLTSLKQYIELRVIN
jgi:hypothetical protein